MISTISRNEVNINFRFPTGDNPFLGHELVIWALIDKHGKISKIPGLGYDKEIIYAVNLKLETDKDKEIVRGLHAISKKLSEYKLGEK